MQYVIMFLYGTRKNTSKSYILKLRVLPYKLFDFNTLLQVLRAHIRRSRIPRTLVIYNLYFMRIDKPVRVYARLSGRLWVYNILPHLSHSLKTSTQYKQNRDNPFYSKESSLYTRELKNNTFLLKTKTIKTNKISIQICHFFINLYILY